jgi:hypothetical protein
MKASILADMEQAIKDLNPHTYKVFTRRGDTIGKEDDPVGMIFILRKQDNLYAVQDFNMGWLMPLSDKEPAYIIQNFALQHQKFITKKELIQNLLLELRLACYCRDSATFTDYWKQCTAQWISHLEDVLKFDIGDKAKGQAEIERALDGVSMLAWWFYDKDFRMAQALEDEKYHKKMKEMKEKFDEMWKLYSEQDWKEIRKIYK